MFKITFAALLACTFAAPVKEEAVKAVEDVKAEAGEAEHGRELFPMLTLKYKVPATVKGARAAAGGVKPMMSLGEDVKGPAKAFSMLGVADEMQTMVNSDSMCSRRQALARAAGLAAGLTLAQVRAPGYAAETKMVKMGSDSGQLVFVPDEIKICKGDTVTWTNNKGGPHNVVFDEEAIPAGVKQEEISMDDQLGEEGETFSKKFDVAGTYGYYCEPHRGAGMTATLIVE